MHQPAESENAKSLSSNTMRAAAFGCGFLARILSPAPEQPGGRACVVVLLNSRQLRQGNPVPGVRATPAGANVYRVRR